MNGWEEYFEIVADFLERTNRELSTASEAYSDYVIEGLQSCSRTLIDIESHLSAAGSNRANFIAPEIAIVEEYCVNVREIIEVVHSLLHLWDVHIDRLQAAAVDYSFRAPTSPHSSRRRGRPRFDIGSDQLVYLSSLNFTWTRIASMMGVSRMTIYRRRRELNLRSSLQSITDGELILTLQEIQHNYPTFGEAMVLGHLRSLGYRVSRDRVRRGIRAIDPISSALRGPRGITARRPYSVPGPNSLWHIGIITSYQNTSVTDSSDLVNKLTI